MNSSAEHPKPLNNITIESYVVTIPNELVDPDDPGNLILEDFPEDAPCLETLLSQRDVSAINPRFQATHRPADGKKLQAVVRPDEVEDGHTAVRRLAIERRDSHIKELIVIKCGPVPVTET